MLYLALPFGSFRLLRFCALCALQYHEKHFAGGGGSGEGAGREFRPPRPRYASKNVIKLFSSFSKLVIYCIIQKKSNDCNNYPYGNMPPPKNIFIFFWLDLRLNGITDQNFSVCSFRSVFVLALHHFHNIIYNRSVCVFHLHFSRIFSKEIRDRCTLLGLVCCCKNFILVHGLLSR